MSIAGTGAKPSSDQGRCSKLATACIGTVDKQPRGDQRPDRGVLLPALQQCSPVGGGAGCRPSAAAGPFTCARIAFADGFAYAFAYGTNPELSWVASAWSMSMTARTLGCR